MTVPSRAILTCLLLALPACPSKDSGSDAAGDTHDVAPDVTPDSATDAPVETIADTTPEVDTAPEVTDTSAPDTDDREVDSEGCFGFDLRGSLVAKDTPGVFQLGGSVDLGLGGPLPDAVIFEFYSDDTGSFDLSANGNDNYKTCKQCVRFVEDIDPTTHQATKDFFQKSGTLTIDPTTPPNGNVLEVTLADLEMIEVTIRAADFQTTAVPNGDCYHHSDAFALATGACQPACGDHVCGPDGCGGTCSPGCGPTERCHLDGSMCEETSTCVKVALTSPLIETDAGVYRVNISSLELGAVGQDDFVQVEFYSAATGTFRLNSSTNRNYSSCEQCFRAVIDGRTDLFQRGGSLTVSDASNVIGDTDTPGFVQMQTAGVILEEVILDDQFNSMAVPNGACIEIEDGSLSSPPLP